MNNLCENINIYINKLTDYGKFFLESINIIEPEIVDINDTNYNEPFLKNESKNGLMNESKNELMNESKNGLMNKSMNDVEITNEMLEITKKMENLKQKESIINSLNDQEQYISTNDELNNIIETNDENITDEPKSLAKFATEFLASQVDVYNNQNNEIKNMGYIAMVN